MEVAGSRSLLIGDMNAGALAGPPQGSRDRLAAMISASLAWGGRSRQTGSKDGRLQHAGKSSIGQVNLCLSIFVSHCQE